MLVNSDASAIASSDATAVVSDLIFTGRENVAVGTGDNLTQLRFESSTLRVSYRDGFAGNETDTANIFPNAAFVGKGLDGPRAVIGIWRIGDGSSAILSGTDQVMVAGRSGLGLSAITVAAPKRRGQPPLLSVSRNPASRWRVRHRCVVP